MRKIMTIIGTRPELIKMSSVIKEFDRYTDHILVHTGQNYDYELNEVFYRDFSIDKPKHYLGVAEDTVAASIANIIVKSDEVMALEQPDALLLYGDTNSCLSVLSAKRRKIPVFHMEAGNRCYDQRVPEEINRKVVDHLSDINLVLAERARANLVAEGIPAERIFKTGSHMFEILQRHKQEIAASDALERLELERGKYFIVSSHREETVDDPKTLADLLFTLNHLADEYEYPVIVSTHPRTRLRIEREKYTSLNERIRFSKPFGFFDYIKLQSNAYCVLSDSGTLTEEASILKFPSVMIRSVHERPEGMDAGITIMCGTSRAEVADAVRIAADQFHVRNFTMPSVREYENDNASSQILRIVLSYIDYVNRVVWSK
ncbi:UDP-N-acetylglucosamine 2-epimerase (non-hydrolyzing) [Mesorhizobium sp. M1399]|uniref:non-hydrolyzing UDP-N-acetylglucosamine 2-epimerase n=1 Tax=Mesorhizobium sp. M1399 TaxID=2957096 RepID=UPI003337F823